MGLAASEPDPPQLGHVLPLSQTLPDADLLFQGNSSLATAGAGPTLRFA